MKQEGDKDTRIGVDVNSFVILSERDRVFGSAGYRSEKQENVLWNENIDWKLIAPYVTGDSIGGFLKGETYYFNGGYASESGSWTWGITGGYRASHNYRDKDPRPRNTASDLSFALGAGYRLGTYRLGVSADFRLYQQKSEISFLADKALLRYTIYWDWAWIMCVSPETRPGRSIKHPVGRKHRHSAS